MTRDPPPDRIKLRCPWCRLMRTPVLFHPHLPTINLLCDGCPSECDRPFWEWLESLQPRERNPAP